MSRKNISASLTNGLKASRICLNVNSSEISEDNKVDLTFGLRSKNSKFSCTFGSPRLASDEECKCRKIY